MSLTSLSGDMAVCCSCYLVSVLVLSSGLLLFQWLHICFSFVLYPLGSFQFLHLLLCQGFIFNPYCSLFFYSLCNYTAYIHFVRYHLAQQSYFPSYLFIWFLLFLIPLPFYARILDYHLAGVSMSTIKEKLCMFSLYFSKLLHCSNTGKKKKKSLFILLLSFL